MKKTLIYSASLAAALAFSSGAATAEVTLSLLVSDGPTDSIAAEALIKAYEADHPDVKIELETKPGGAEGDNLVKTRLATGEMADIFVYNSGSLFQAIKPTRNLVDLSDLPAQENILDSFKSVVSADGKVYGVPFGTAMGGGIFYNRSIYEKLGLSVPKTWEEFMANNAKIQESGTPAVAQTYKDTWTSQLFVLADYFNVQAANPDFATEYTANKAKYATTPAAMRGFEHLQEVYEAGYMNEDFGAATFDDGMRMVATGEAGHYPMLTFAIEGVKQNHPDSIDELGFFAQPGDSADSNGLTVWMPSGMYIANTTEHMEEAMDFVNFAASVAACDIRNEAVGASGPYLVQGCSIPDQVPPAVTDMIPYFQTSGMTAPALEFLSPIKGPALEQITVEVGSGIRPAADGAALYDQDVEKQAKQLGLPNW